MANKTAVLEAKVAELENALRVNEQIRQNLYGVVDDAKKALIQIIWALDSVQQGNELDTCAWMHVEHDACKAMSAAHRVEILLGDMWKWTDDEAE